MARGSGRWPGQLCRSARLRDADKDMQLRNIFSWLTKLYAVVAAFAVAVAVSLILESVGVPWLQTSSRAYRLLVIFFLLGLPFTLFVGTLIASLSRAVLDWMKRNA